MLLTRALPAAGLLTFAAYLLPVLSGQPNSPPAPVTTLPLTRVTLFTAGVGYFHREGAVDGSARVDVKVPEADINDLIKTLVASDPAGTPRAVTYDNKTPAEVTLKASPIDLSDNPSVSDLLLRVRGEAVEITDERGGVVAGSVVSLVKGAPTAVRDKDGAVTEVADPGSLNLLTEDGLRGVPVAKIAGVKFAKPELQAEFRKALAVLAAARGAATKTVAVTFAGAGRRTVALGYVTEAPLWKPTYRVNLNDAGATVQGWAAVENTTDEDWNDVKLNLVSGRPTAFRMDLYDPLYVPRPTVEPELYASLRPPVFQGNVNPAQAGNPTGQGMQGGIGGGFGGQIGNMAGGTVISPLPQPAAPNRSRLSYDEFLSRQYGQGRRAGGTADVVGEVQDFSGRPGGASADFGQSFRYDVAEPVRLPRFKSALLPVVSETAGVERVSIFNPDVLPRHPMLGFRLTNKSKQFLAQGPVAVYVGGTYAGDARLPDVQPGETRLLSYAIDLDVQVADADGTVTRTPAGLRIAPEQNFSRASLTEQTMIRSTAKYAVRNRSSTARTVLVSLPVLPGRKLVVPEKPTDRTADLYRFEVKVGSASTATLEVAHEWTDTVAKPVADLSVEETDRYLGLATTPAAVKAVLTRVKADRAKLADAEKAAADEDAALRAIADDQARMRLNIERVPKESQAFQRYLKKFDDQETEIERRQARVKELRADLAKQRQSLDEYLRDLKAD